MVAKVFIDGEAGTTGLQIRERLDGRADVDLISVDPARRKDADARAEAFTQADIAILCLPDDAAREAVTLAGDTRIIDASTAHRIAPGWTYGMPELPGQREAIAGATRVANVGCYATGSIALVRPLRDAGILPPEYAATLTGVSGYTGGGKALIAEYDAGTAPAHFLYALGQSHKHVPEIMRYATLTVQPAFQPAVGNFAQGMVVQLHLHRAGVNGDVTRDTLEEAMRAFYAEARFVEVTPAPDRLDPQAVNGSNRMLISVHGDDTAGIWTLTATLDNLGKGASGTAVQNLNLMIGADEGAGL
ncbi:MAG: N-acetyl-gamma-glutamyl-phosphate reductase [Roseovarius sp.]|uniref:N-acetyl-gamma-glutamyl-phosphate reductase n=1 Tax=Alterinioella nitratireducens TaxID=2735915 RepID=UPI001553BD09|nr:N-acetyl-gamma-glutamyl-phosphate reductase [Alterinioella nitratireducens]NPD21441.1 N-acetyl-gamma-glutamyl-phosphate reductase [Alterinioella nitratireducens]